MDQLTVNAGNTEFHNITGSGSFNATSLTNLSFYGLSNALIYFSNGTVPNSCLNINSCDGNINITTYPLNSSLVLENFSLIEGSPRTNSPINITSKTETSISVTYSISSLLVNEVTIPNQLTLPNRWACSDIDSITITPKDLSSYPGSPTCSNNIITLNANYTYSTSSNTILITLGQAGLNDFCDATQSGYPDFFSGVIVIFVILAVGILIFILMAIVKVIQGDELDLSIIEDVFEVFDVKVVLYSILAITILVWTLIIMLGVFCA